MPAPKITPTTFFKTDFGPAQHNKQSGVFKLPRYIEMFWTPAVAHAT
jgi:hypothetical protein